MIASPASTTPWRTRGRRAGRRDLVLARMLEQQKSRGPSTRRGSTRRCPRALTSTRRGRLERALLLDLADPAAVDRTARHRVRRRPEDQDDIDTELQAAAEQAIAGRLYGYGPSASLVAIENKTGEIKAMVGGTDYRQNAFNLATNGHRQPGSAFKPFTLVRALADGVSPETTFVSEPRTFNLRAGPSRSTTTTTTTTGSSRCASATDHVGQLRVRGARPEGGHAPDRAHGAADGHPHAALDQPGHDAGRPAGGSHAARDGLRLLDDRQQRRPQVGLAGSGRRGPGGSGVGQGQGHR